MAYMDRAVKNKDCLTAERMIGRAAFRPLVWPLNARNLVLARRRRTCPLLEACLPWEVLFFARQACVPICGQGEAACVAKMASGMHEKSVPRPNCAGTTDSFE
jgi:hypothetical protein